MKKLLTISIFVLIALSSCDNPSSPQISEGIYTYSHSKEEVAKVYGANGEELSVALWTEEMKSMKEYHKNFYEGLDEVEFEFVGNKMTITQGEYFASTSYKMKGDTITFTMYDDWEDETITINYAFKTDENTIERHVYSFRADYSSGTRLNNGFYIGDYEKFKKEYDEIKETLQGDGYVAEFFTKMYYTK